MYLAYDGMDYCTLLTFGNLKFICDKINISFRMQTAMLVHIPPVFMLSVVF
jgi:hypothetical protein